MIKPTLVYLTSVVLNVDTDAHNCSAPVIRAIFTSEKESKCDNNSYCLFHLGIIKVLCCLYLSKGFKYCKRTLY